jgi:hypothetical protein
VTAARGYMTPAARADWRTPAEIVELLHVLWDGKPDLDPCASPDPAHAIARRNLSGPSGSAADGLAWPWTGRVFVNPPFGDLATWTMKAVEEALRGAEIVFLLPARTDTRYWHADIASAAAVCFWRGRLRFVGAPAPCPFPTALAYWGPRPWDFQRVFAPRGMVVAPPFARRMEG